MNRLYSSEHEYKQCNRQGQQTIDPTWFPSYLGLLLPTRCRWRGLLWHLTKLNDTRTHAHTEKHTHPRVRIPWLGTGPSHNPLPDNTQHWQEADIHALGGIRIRNFSMCPDAEKKTHYGSKSKCWQQRNILLIKNEPKCEQTDCPVKG
jgi:hypothetical protein